MTSRMSVTSTVDALQIQIERTGRVSAAVPGIVLIAAPVSAALYAASSFAAGHPWLAAAGAAPFALSWLGTIVPSLAIPVSSADISLVLLGGMLWIVAAALDCMRDHKLPQATIALLTADAERRFAGRDAFMEHLTKLGLTTLKVHPGPVQIASEGGDAGRNKGHRGAAGPSRGRYANPCGALALCHLKL